MRNVLLTCALVLLCGLAQAAPPAGPIDPEMHEWYGSLRQPGTDAGCCSIADCRLYVSRIATDHYEIRVYGKWYPVPTEVVLHRENKAGSAVACLRTNWNEEAFTPPASFTPDIICFVPGPET